MTDEARLAEAREIISEWLAHDLTRCLDTELAELRNLIAAALASRDAEIKRLRADAAAARRAALEEAARLVDRHPDAEDASEGCEDARGCCELMAAQIRSLATTPQPDRRGSRCGANE